MELNKRNYNIVFMKKLLTKRKRYAKMVVTSERRVGFSKYLVGRKKEKIMSGTKAGGLKAAQTNREKYGKEFYSNIGRKGGQMGHTGGFAANPALARIAGAKGGRISRRGPAKKTAK